MFRINELSKIYGNEENGITVLKNISLDIADDEFVAITGMSGAGKSTLLNIISTIDKATSGTIEFNGNRIDNISQQKCAELRLNKFGFIFQKYYLLSTLNIYDNIVVPVVMANKNIDTDYFETIVEWLDI